MSVPVCFSRLLSWTDLLVSLLSLLSLSLSLSLSRSRSPALFVAARCFVAPFVVLQGVGCPLLVVLTRMLAVK